MCVCITHVCYFLCVIMGFLSKIKQNLIYLLFVIQIYPYKKCVYSCRL